MCGSPYKPLYCRWIRLSPAGKCPLLDIRFPILQICWAPSILPFMRPLLLIAPLWILHSQSLPVPLAFHPTLNVYHGIRILRAGTLAQKCDGQLRLGFFATGLSCKGLRLDMRSGKLVVKKRTSMEERLEYSVIWLGVLWRRRLVLNNTLSSRWEATSCLGPTE